MATMRTQLLVLFLVALLNSTGLVNSFSISKHRSERNTDLAEALAILQRQRRRVGVEDFLNSERLLQDRPLTLEDVSDWLSRSNGNDDVMQEGRVDSWIPEVGRFKDFDLPDAGEYMSPIERFPPTRMKASDNEVNDIFASDEDLDQGDGKLEKKKKEEYVNPKGDAQMENSQEDLSPSSESLPVYDTEPSGNDGDVLNSLTDEEIRVLIKAVGKLQHREGDSAKVKKSPEISDLSVGPDDFDSLQNDEDVVISEPVSQEELKSVFKETNGPISKETIVVENKDPDKDTPEVIEQQIVSEKLPDDSTIVRERELTNLSPQDIAKEIEAAEQEEQENDAAEEAAAEEAVAEAEEAEKFQEAAEAVANEEAEEEIANARSDGFSPEVYSKYLLMKKNNLFQNHIPRGTSKRTAKRASGLYSAKEVLSGDDIRNLVGDVDLKNLDTSSLIQAFVMKILTLQTEIDGLKVKNRLEDMENDELTDALNEATMGQREGSVSNDEWSSLQHAIEIEQALQDLKKKEASTDLANYISDEDDVSDDTEDDEEDYKRKRGEPWKRMNDVSNDDVYSGAIASRSPVQDYDEQRNRDIERLLKSSYLMKLNDEDDEDVGDEGLDEGEEDEPVASLFLSHADRCPAIRLYSNNCELADLYNLPVDFEARALCNLHEMCYACGHSLSVTQAQCDLVYRAAVNSLCHGKEVCVAESEIFLRTMKLKTRFIPHSQPSCRTRCTAQFMGMF